MTEEPVAVVGGRVVPVAGDPIDGGTVLAEAGRITAVGTGLAIPPGTRVIAAAGRWVLPGFIEAHGHHRVPRRPGQPARRADPAGRHRRRDPQHLRPV